MIKRMMLMAGMALAAIAFAAPVAQAEVYLHEGGVKLGAGAEVTATSNNLVTTRPGGTKLECASVKLNFEVNNAGTEHVTLAQIEDAETAGCKFNREAVGLPNLPVTFDDYTVGLGVGEGGSLTLNTWGTAVTKTSFLSTIFADANHTVLAAACLFEGTVHFEMTGGQTSDVLGITGSALSGPCGEGTIHGDFTLVTTPDPTKAVSVHHVVTP